MSRAERIEYSLDDLDAALGDSMGAVFWSTCGPSTPGYSRVMMINRAAAERWLSRMPEDANAAIIRQAYDDLCKESCLKPTDWSTEDRD